MKRNVHIYIYIYIYIYKIQRAEPTHTQNAEPPIHPHYIISRVYTRTHTQCRACAHTLILCRAHTHTFYAEHTQKYYAEYTHTLSLTHNAEYTNTIYYAQTSIVLNHKVWFKHLHIDWFFCLRTKHHSRKLQRRIRV